MQMICLNFQENQRPVISCHGNLNDTNPNSKKGTD